jgi:flagellar protein FliO/FliZ
MDFTDVFRYVGALALVLGLVGAAGLAMRRYGLPGLPGSASRRLRIVESLILGRNHRLVIVRCDNTDHVMVVAPQGATLISSQAAPVAQIAIAAEATP